MSTNESGPGSLPRPADEPAAATADGGGVAGVELVTIRLIGLPVPLQAKAQEHADELTRELMLIGEQMRQRGDHAGLPARLVALVEQLTGTYSSFTAEQEQQLADAIATRVPTIDLIYAVPAEVGDAAKSLGAILDEADEYCRAGEHLLTLPTPPDLVRYRQWFLDQFVNQVGGAEPVSFADYRPSCDPHGVPEADLGDPADPVPAPRH